MMPKTRMLYFYDRNGNPAMNTNTISGKPMSLWKLSSLDLQEDDIYGFFHLYWKVIAVDNHSAILQRV